MLNTNFPSHKYRNTFLPYIHNGAYSLLAYGERAYGFLKWDETAIDWMVEYRIMDGYVLLPELHKANVDAVTLLKYIPSI